MKLELKYLAPYLPYNLMLTKEDWGKNGELVPFIKKDFKGLQIEIDYALNTKAKPILRPYSSLTDELLTEIFNDPDLDIVRMKYAIVVNYKLMKDWFKETISLRTYNDEACLTMSAWLYNELLEHHFDVFGLIEKGLAIDINTLK